MAILIEQKISTFAYFAYTQNDYFEFEKNVNDWQLELWTFEIHKFHQNKKISMSPSPPQFTKI